MSIIPKLTYRFNAITIKIPLGLHWIKIDKLILNFLWKNKGSRIADNVKEGQCLRIMPSDITTYHKTVTEYGTGTKTNRPSSVIVSPETDLHIHCHFVFETDTILMYFEARILKSKLSGLSTWKKHKPWLLAHTIHKN